MGGGIQRWREATSLWQGPDAHAEYLQRSYRDAFELSVAVNNDLVRTSYWRLNATPAARIDEYTFLYGDPDGEYEVRRYDPDTEMFPTTERVPPAREPTFDQIEKELAEAEEALESYQPTRESFASEFAALEYYGDEYAIPGNGVGTGLPYEPIWMEAIALRPDLVARKLELSLQRCLRSLRFQKDLPFIYLKGGGDFASNHGPFYSPRAFHELVLPRLQRYCEEAHEYGKFVLFASDGDLWPVGDDLFGASGLDGYYEIDRRAGMDLRRLREAYPDLTLMGNVSSHTLHLGTLEEVEAECRDVAETAMELGSILAGVSNYPQIGSPPENILAMLRIFEEYR